MLFLTMRSSLSGTSDLELFIGFGSTVRTDWITDSGLLPGNGGSPVIIS
jgi:hypothetical protein